MQSSLTESSIYITVISDASVDRYPANTTSHFKVDLAQPIELEGTWQVALTEIHISNNSYDITEDCSIDVSFENSLERSASFKSLTSSPNTEIRVDNWLSSGSKEEEEEEEEEELPEQNFFSVNVRKNSFPSLTHLCLYLTNEISNQIPNDLLAVMPQCSAIDIGKPFIDFQIDPLLGTVSIFSIKGVNASVSFRKFDDIFSILSLDLSNYNTYDLPIVGERRASLFAGNIGLFVLCNLINFQNVGNSQIRLLRIVPIKSSDRREDRHSHYFQKSYYLSCITNSFQTIEFELRKDNNRPIIFPPDSKIILVLHFKRKLTI